MTIPIVSSEDFARLLLDGVPFIDVRAEVEFAKGSLPNAVNLPILNTAERHEVGTVYREQGQASAIEVGHERVSGDVREQRTAAWCDFARHNPNTHVFCWRGGMRSNLAVEWMHAAGYTAPVIEGGFKALRRFLIQVLEAAATQPLLRLGGRTGSGKTGLLHTLANGIDLEGHANHRGSSFGRRASQVPTQIDFEHALAVDLLRFQHQHQHQHQQLIVEDESMRIGAVSIPLPFFDAMRNAPMVVIDRLLAERVAVIRRLYVEDLLQEYIALGCDRPQLAFARHLQDALKRISKRLGGERYQRFSRLLNDALASGNSDDHDRWIEPLLTDYYDPLYDYQLDKLRPRIVFQGNYQAVSEWLAANDRICTAM
ncbi:MAG: tRNA 2-selenouridine(34) synthase MnmH [Pseudomonadales bacterium]